MAMSMIMAFWKAAFDAMLRGQHARIVLFVIAASVLHNLSPGFQEQLFPISVGGQH